MKEQHLLIPCDVCSQSTRRGLLWLGGGDWVECPQCVGTAKIEVIQKECPPTGRLFIPGFTQGAAINKEWSRRF